MTPVLARVLNVSLYVRVIATCRAKHSGCDCPLRYRSCSSMRNVLATSSAMFSGFIILLESLVSSIKLQI